MIAALWCGYWAAGTYAIHRGVMQGIDAALRQGNHISPVIVTAGFPTSFDVTLQDLDLGHPPTGMRWQTPTLQVQAAMWRPWHVVALLDDAHTLTTPTEELALLADDIRASLTVTPDTSLTLSQFATTLIRPALQSSLGWRGVGDIAEIHLNHMPDQPNTYAATLNLTNVQIDPAFMTATGLDGTIARIAVDGTITLSAPLDRFAGQTQPQVTAIALSNAGLEWGDVTVAASGTINADAQGLAEGRIAITVTNWRLLVSALVGTATVSASEGRMIEGFLNAIATEAGDAETLSVPLVYQNGVGLLGPIPLGPAPRLVSPGLITN